MNRILFLFFTLLWTSGYSMTIKTTAPKFCVNCKYFIEGQTGIEFGKCALFERGNNNHFLVTGGENMQNTHNLYCQTVRNSENMCGKEGKRYKRKYVKRVKKVLLPEEEKDF